jgi:hypothetical protein
MHELPHGVLPCRSCARREQFLACVATLCLKHHGVLPCIATLCMIMKCHTVCCPTDQAPGGAGAAGQGAGGADKERWAQGAGEGPCCSRVSFLSITKTPCVMRLKFGLSCSTVSVVTLMQLHTVCINKVCHGGEPQSLEL